MVLDAVVVRMLLLPALVSLLGRANWWMPQRAARWLRIKPEPAAATAASIEDLTPALVGS